MSALFYLVIPAVLALARDSCVKLCETGAQARLVDQECVQQPESCTLGFRLGSFATCSRKCELGKNFSSVGLTHQAVKSASCLGQLDVNACMLGFDQGVEAAAIVAGINGGTTASASVDVVGLSACNATAHTALCASMHAAHGPTMYYALTLIISRMRALHAVASDNGVQLMFAVKSFPHQVGTSLSSSCALNTVCEGGAESSLG
jgi:hypothetical protein